MQCAVFIRRARESDSAHIDCTPITLTISPYAVQSFPLDIYSLVVCSACHIFVLQARTAFLASNSKMCGRCCSILLSLSRLSRCIMNSAASWKSNRFRAASPPTSGPHMLSICVRRHNAVVSERFIWAHAIDTIRSLTWYQSLITCLLINQTISSTRVHESATRVTGFEYGEYGVSVLPRCPPSSPVAI